MKNTNYIFCFIIFIFSCQHNNYNDHIKVKSILLDINTENKIEIDEFKYWIILPSQGCSSCIHQTLSFFLENQEKSKDMLLIVTMNSDIKVLNYQLGIDYKQFSNIMIDLQNRLSLQGIGSIYPEIFINSESGVFKRIKIRPENSNELYKILNQE